MVFGNLLALGFEFDVPVSIVNSTEERLPFAVVLGAEISPHKRGPAGPARLAAKLHPSLRRRPPPFSPITVQASAHDVFPGGQPPAGTGHNMVEVQIGPRFALIAVLASVGVTNENIVSTELHLSAGHPIETDHLNNAWNTNEPPNNAHSVAADGTQRRPIAKVEGPIFLVDRPSHPGVEETEGPADRCHLNGEIGTVEDKRFTAQPGRARSACRHRKNVSSALPAVKARSPPCATLRTRTGVVLFAIFWPVAGRLRLLAPFAKEEVNACANR